MELKAENSFTITEELFYEGMRRLIARDYMPIAKKAVIAVAAIWLLLAGITVYSNAHFFYTLLELVVSVFVCVWLWFFVPRSRLKRAWRAQESSGADMTRTTRFYEDRMEVEKGSGDVLIINYEDVADVIESERLLILINSNHVGVMAAKDSFSKGDAEVVKDLVKEWSL